MKLSLRELNTIKPSLANFLTIKRFKGITKYKMNKLLKKIDAEFEPFDKARIELFKKYGKEDPKTRMITVLDENIEQHRKELQELEEQEIEIDIQPVEMDINEIDGENNLSTKDIMVLDDKFIKIKE